MLKRKQGTSITTSGEASDTSSRDGGCRAPRWPEERRLALVAAVHESPPRGAEDWEVCLTLNSALGSSPISSFTSSESSISLAAVRLSECLRLSGADVDRMRVHRWHAPFLVHKLPRNVAGGQRRASASMLACCEHEHLLCTCMNLPSGLHASSPCMLSGLLMSF